MALSFLLLSGVNMKVDVNKNFPLLRENFYLTSIKHKVGTFLLYKMSANINTFAFCEG